MTCLKTNRTLGRQRTFEGLRGRASGGIITGVCICIGRLRAPFRKDMQFGIGPRIKLIRALPRT